MRLPLAVNLRSRDGALTKDARVQNALIEKVGEDQSGPLFDILSRPGMSDGGAVGGSGGAAQLLYVWNGALHAILNDILSIGSVAQLAVNSVTLNPSDKGASVTLSNGNLTAAFAAATLQVMVRATLSKAAGKWYCEVTLGTIAGGIGILVGVAKSTASLTDTLGADANGWAYGSLAGNKFNNDAHAGGVAYGAAAVTGDIIGIAIDITAGTLTFYKNGVSLGVAYNAGIAGGTFFPAVSGSAGGAGACTINFGATPFTYSVPSGYLPWIAVASASALSPTNTGLQFDAQETNANAANPRLMIKNRTQAWRVSTAGVPTAITLPGTMGAYTAYATAITRSGSTATAAYGTSGRVIRIGDSVTIAGANNAAYNGTFTVTAVNTSAWPYTFSYTVAGTPTTPDGGASIQITVNGGMVRGIPYINGYFCIMDVNGVVWHSAADDPSTWSSTAFFTSRNENGAGVALGKSQNYLIALKEWSTEFYYDAHNTTGSAFSPVENGFVRVGCAAGDSVVALAAVQLVWIGQTRAQGYGVYAMQGLNVRKISTEDVDRVLASSTLDTGVYSFGLNCRGHELYVVTIASSNVTLVFDFASEQWTTWTSLTLGAAVSVSSITRDATTATVTAPAGLSDGDPVKIAGANESDYNGIFQIRYFSSGAFFIEVANSPASPATGTITATPYTESYFKMIRAAAYQGATVFLHETDGHLYQMSASLYQDAGIPINIFSRTERLDGGNDGVKKMARVRVICDSSGAGTAMLRWSDDDAQTFAAYRLMNLASDPCETNKCGAFRRRTLSLRHVANATLRARALEVN